MSNEVAAFFDEKIYCEMHTDVAVAVRNGVFASGLQHFRCFGAEEGRALRSRTDRGHGRIGIAGTGRAGTTVLVQIFTALGFDTGFDLQQALTTVDRISNAGLECDLGPDSPLVSKSPWLAERYHGAASILHLGMNFVIFPMRSLFQAAESRRRVQEAAKRAGVEREGYPGGLWLTNDPAKQEPILARQFYESVWLALQSDLQLMFLQFPKFVRDPDYLWDRLRLLWQVYGVSRSELLAASASVVDENKISIE